MSAPSSGADARRNSPVLIGTARRTYREGDKVPEPLEMWVEMARDAADDARARVDAIPRIDHLGLVHCQSWAYDDPSGRLAERLGVPGATRQESILAGTSPQRLLDAAAERMLRGECRVALVVGGEALAERRRWARSGEEPPWRHQHPEPPTLPIDLDEWYLPTELAHGILPAWLTFALLEQARWAARGGVEADRRHLGELMARLNATAAQNPDAWFRRPADADELCRPSDSNRMVALPYTKRITAFMDVDMAAANLMVTTEVADEWGVPEDRRIHLRGWGFARDAVHLGARADLASSAGMRTATGAALSMAGLTTGDVDVFDLYSCFGSAVQFAMDALGLAPDDPRPISLTGGLPYHGGPSSNYMSHSISHLVDHLRTTGGTGLVTGVGMHMTKHVAGIWSTEPGALSAGHGGDEPQQWEAAPVEPDVVVAARGDGPANVLAATVVHHGDGTPSHLVAICELADGTRCYATSQDRDAIDVVVSGDWVELKGQVRDRGDGTNDLRW